MPSNKKTKQNQKKQNDKIVDKNQKKEIIESDNESESEDEIPVKKTSNAFGGFLMDSDSESESENSDESKVNDSEEEEEETKEEINEKVNNKQEKQKNNKNIITNNEINQIVYKEENNKNEKQKNKKESKKENKKESKKQLMKENKKNNRNEIDQGKTNLYVKDVELIVGGKILINESNIVINTNTKYFIMGSNGIGKSSLVKHIYEELQNKEDILMIDQHVKIEENETVLNFTLKANKELYDKQIRFEELEKKEELTDQEMNLYEELSEYLITNEWDKYSAEAKKILHGMGFNDLNINTNILSGGWRVRASITRALLKKPKILILDEPSNHLDLDANIWLTNYLETYPETLIVITHQIDLVNSVSNIVWYVGNIDLTGNKVHVIRGNYNNVLKKLESTQKELEKNYDKFQKEIKGMRNKSKPKKEVDEYIKKNSTPRPPKEYKVKIEFENIPSPGSDKIIQFNDVTFGYDPDINKKIFRNINLTISTDSRIVIVGPNGAGKTTFFNLCANLIQPDEGYIIKDERLRVGYFNQNVADSLPENTTPIEYLKSINGSLQDGDCRAILGKIGIKKTENGYDLPNTLIRDLSGGQKSRVSIASAIQLKKPHLIMLDEISNHLDIESIEGLIEGINAFNSAVVLITHDIYLIKNINNAVLYEVNKEEKNIIKFNGDFDDYVDKIVI